MTTSRRSAAALTLLLGALLAAVPASATPSVESVRAVAAVSGTAHYRVVRAKVAGRQLTPERTVRRALQRVGSDFRSASGGAAPRVEVSFRTIRLPRKWESCRRQGRDFAGMSVELMDRAGLGLPDEVGLDVVVTPCPAAYLLNGFATAYPLRSWSSPSVFHVVGLAAHDMHLAGSWSCAQDGTPTAFAGVCSASTYGDPFSSMGAFDLPTPMLDAVNLADARWLAPARIRTATSDTSVALSPLLGDGATRAVRVKLLAADRRSTPTARWLWIEYRTDVPAAGQGVQLRLDTLPVEGFGTPTSSGLVSVAPPTEPTAEPDLGQYVLQPGTSIATPSGITVSVDSVGATAAVRVDYPG